MKQLVMLALVLFFLAACAAAEPGAIDLTAGNNGETIDASSAIEGHSFSGAQGLGLGEAGASAVAGLLGRAGRPAGPLDTLFAAGSVAGRLAGPLDALLAEGGIAGRVAILVAVGVCAWKVGLWSRSTRQLNIPAAGWLGSSPPGPSSCIGTRGS